MRTYLAVGFASCVILGVVLGERWRWQRELREWKALRPRVGAAG